jgi:beta-lactamase superfamily II metal-dependent hydrolase
MDRRRFLEGTAASLALVALARMRAEQMVVAGTVMEPWQRGFLDIHHISTGRGNSVLAIYPDGTSLMIDAGAKAGTGADLAVPRPDASRRPGEWIGRYAKHHLRSAPKQEIDTFLLTHLHDDHMGTCSDDSPMSADGTYRLTGVSDVAEVLPIGRIVDRGWPEYGYPAPQTDKSALNYIAFVRSSARRGVKVEKVVVGSSRQIALLHEVKAFGAFSVRNLAANGNVWTGEGDGSRALFPRLETLERRAYPTQNMCSAALRIGYGGFSYYNGGDLTCDTMFGTEPWMDVETAVARVAGPVSVAALNHHGYYDGSGPDFVRAMRARIWVLQSWHASHPALATLDRLYSPVLYSEARDVLATSLVEAAELADARLSDRMLSRQGHVVIRVSPGGGSYEVMVLDDAVEEGTVKARFGPYLS